MTAAVKAEAIGRVLASAVQAQRRPGRFAFWWVLAALLVAASLAAWLLLPPDKGPRVALVLLLIVATTLVVAAWAMLCFNVLLQNQPGLARTVPGQVTALRYALGGSTLVLVLVGMAVSAAISGVVTPGLLIVAVPCGLVAAGLRWPLAWLVLPLVGWTLPWWQGGAALRALLETWTTWPLACNLALLLGVAAVLRAVVMGGGERHVRAHARLQVAAVVMRGQVPQAALARPGGGSWLWAQRATWRTASAWTDAVLRRSGSLDARLPLGLGPQAHLGGLLGGFATGVVMTVLFVAIAWLWPRWEIGAALRGGAIGGLAVAASMAGLQLLQALHASRREQALLRLLPGVPHGPALNHWQALHAARQVGVALLLYGALLLGALAVIDMPDSWKAWQPIVLGAMATAPWSLVLLWRDWSRAAPPGGLTQTASMLGVMVATGSVAAWTLLLGRPWWELPLAADLLLLPVLWWRWRRLARLPAAWPVGRLARGVTETSR